MMTSLTEEAGSESGKWKSSRPQPTQTAARGDLLLFLRRYLGDCGEGNERAEGRQRKLKEDISFCLPWTFSKRFTAGPLGLPHTRTHLLDCGHTQSPKYKALISPHSGFFFFFNTSILMHTKTTLRKKEQIQRYHASWFQTENHSNKNKWY